MELCKINYHIKKEAEGSYFAIPFQMPEGFEQVTISYQYKKEAIVDLGLMNDDGQFLGWSGSARKSIWVSPHGATPGYAQAPLTPGEWKILVGAYKIPEPGLDVQYTIQFTPPSRGWLVGDLHVHSDASDGQHDISTLAKRARKKGLDFLAVANHNNYNENFHLPLVPGVTLIPAVEWTHYKGHMNFYGVGAPFENFIANSCEEMKALVRAAKEKGALISVCHPKEKHCGFVWELTEEEKSELFDLVEVWNGPMRPTNVQGIAWWHHMLLAGNNKPLIGGSDYHRDFHPVLLGHPVTWVYAKGRSAEDILAAIEQGHSYVANTRNGVKLSFSAGEAMMGDTVSWLDGLTFEITIKGSGLGLKAKLITSEEVIVLASNQESIKVKPSWRFAYLVVVRKMLGFERIVAISNPIYLTKI